MGRIDPVKGLEWLFRSLPRLSFPLQLEIVGDGQKDYLQSLKTLASQLEIEKRISWAGWLSEGPKFDKIRSADLIVLLSRHENFANVVLESLAVGTPVLLSDQVGLSDYVLENDLGWVTPLDQEKISQTLEAAFRDSEKRRRIREHAPGIIRRDFDAGRVAEGYLGAYMEVSKPSFHGKKK
ncbi:MAG: glycosyltransferase [Saprospirales bacterium]|nr:glycosyltransferase [Saprospirales bacterium]